MQGNHKSQIGEQNNKKFANTLSDYKIRRGDSLTKGDDLKKSFEDDAEIRACLLQQQNYDAIVDGLSNNDDKAVKTVFNQCGVPKNKQAKLLKYAKDCHDQHVHPW